MLKSNFICQHIKTYFLGMDTNKPWSFQATSTDLKRFLASFRIFDPEDQTRSSFAKSVLSAIRCNEIEDTIHLLSSKDVVLQSDLSNQAGHATSKKVYVFKVEVFCTEGTLKVREKVCKGMAGTHI